MTDNPSGAEIYSVRAPDDTIVLVPTSMDHVYHHINGNHVLCLLMDTKKHGPMQIALSPNNARYIAAHLQGMLGQLDELREKYTERNK
jgi:hypothetical protein